MMQHLLCVGVKRAGVTTVCYIDNGRVVVKIISSLKQPSREAPQGVSSHG